MRYFLSVVCSIFIYFRFWFALVSGFAESGGFYFLLPPASFTCCHLSLVGFPHRQERYYISCGWLINASCASLPSYKLCVRFARCLWLVLYLRRLMQSSQGMDRELSLFHGPLVLIWRTGGLLNSSWPFYFQGLQLAD